VNSLGFDFTGFFPVSFSHADTKSLDGVVGGGQVGYNWQASPSWVYGVEADWQAASQKASQSHSDPYVTLGASTLSTTYEAKISWFGTVRGRVGYAWDRLLIYGTGGLCLWRAATCRNNDGQRQFFRHAIQRDYTLRCVECEGGLDRGCRC